MTQPPSQPGTPDPYGQQPSHNQGSFPPPPPMGSPGGPPPPPMGSPMGSTDGPPPSPYPQQPYGAGPYGGPPVGPGGMPPGAKRRRRRPHPLWWLLPGVFLLAGALMFWIPVMNLAQAFTKPATEFTAGAEVQVALPDDGLHFVWTTPEAEADAAGCVFTDAAGKRYKMQQESTPGQQAPEGFAIVGAIDAKAGDYTVTCPVTGADYQVSVSNGVSIGQIGAIGLSFVVGFIGLILLIIMAVLAITGASRKQPRY